MTQEHQTAQVILKAPSGFHARPASMFAKLTKDFPGDIVLRYGSHTANGKSVMNLLALGAGLGSELVVDVTGPNASEVLKTLVGFLETME